MDENQKIKKDYINLDRDIPISELVERFPEVVHVLQEEYEFHCVNCMFSDFDTLEAGASLHGIEGEDFEDMLKHLEEVINQN